MGGSWPRDAAPSCQDQDQGLKIMYTNARSIVNKIDELKSFVHTSDFDIICITEAWTNTNISNHYLSIPGFHIVSRHDRNDTQNGRGGGIIIYIKEHLKANEIASTCEFKQYAGVQIITNSCALNLFVVYRSPNSTHENNEKLLDLLKDIKNPAIILGDFNYPGINWGCLSGPGDLQRLVDLTLDKFWDQWVSFPTHTSGNCLDLVFAESGFIVDLKSEAPLGSSDHNTIIIDTIKLHNHTAIGRQKFNYRRADFELMKRLFHECDWFSMLSGNDINESWLHFKHKYDEVVSRCVPICQNNTKQRPSWMTAEISRLIRNKRGLWKKYKHDSTNANYCNFKAAEKALKKKIRKTKLGYERKIASNSKNNPKAFYAYIGSKRSNKSGVGPLQDENGAIVTDDKVQAQMFNKYYASVFEVEAALLPSHTVTTSSENFPTLNSVYISKELVRDRLKELKRQCSPGPDGIASIVLIEACDELAYPLMLLFQKSLQLSALPDDWKRANVTPVHKSGSLKSVSNYRPISLTSIVCKILEKILKTAITSHLIGNNLLRNSQHGFMPKKSCLTNLLHCMEEVTTILDNGDCADILYLDFAKAFYKVPHQRLLAKVKAFGIDGQILEWIKAWLSGRKQRVVLNGKHSEWIDVLCSVCQGSVLGPLLFLIFIDDIDLCLHEITMLLLKFADDTKVIKRISSIEDSHALQDTITNLQGWAKKWQMCFNIGKCKILHIGNNNPKHKYYMEGSELLSVESEKDLGILIDSSAKPSAQCTVAAKKGNQVLGQLLRSFKARDKGVLTQLYKVFVRPHLEYAVQAWCPYAAKDIDILEKVQKRFVRQVSGISGTYEDKLKKIGLTTLAERRVRGDCIETFKMLNGITRVDPSTWFKKLSRTGGAQTRLSRDPLALQTRMSRLDLRKNFFSVRLPPLWNSLPLNIRQSKSVNEFKNSYDRYHSSH